MASILVARHRNSSGATPGATFDGQAIEALRDGIKTLIEFDRTIIAGEAVRWRKTRAEVAARKDNQVLGLVDEVGHIAPLFFMDCAGARP